jgi:hypothetical protein
MKSIPWLAIVKDWFGLVAVVIAAVSAIGFSVSAPWPAKAEVEAVQRTIEETQKQLAAQQCLILRVLLRGYQDDLQRAEEDIAHDPASNSAKRSKSTAEAGITDILAQLRAYKCL